MLRNQLRTSLVISKQAVRRFSSINTKYVAEASSIGGRAGGRSELKNGELTLNMEMPPGLGGKGTGRNPEELFGMGFSTCFAGAMGAVYRSLYPKNPKFPSTTRVDASVHLGTPKDTNIPGFMLAVKLEVPYSSLEGSNLSVEEAKKLVEKAHEFCPYSRATRGNIEVEVKLVE